MAQFLYSGPPGSPNSTNLMSTFPVYDSYCICGVEFEHILLYTLENEAPVSMELVGLVPDGLELEFGPPGVAKISGTPTAPMFDSYVSPRLASNCSHSYVDVKAEELVPATPDNLPSAEERVTYNGSNWNTKGYSAYAIDNGALVFSFQIVLATIINSTPPVPAVYTSPTFTITLIPCTDEKIFRDRYLADNP